MKQERSDDRLDLWKDIAAYLNRGVSTVQRWEKREGMPVHRHVHDKLGSVYAFRSELDRWWAQRGAQLERDYPEPAPGSAPSGQAATTRRGSLRTASTIAAASVGAAVVLAIGLPAYRAATLRDAPVVRFDVPAPPGTTWDSVPSLPAPAVSPDGATIALIALDADGTSRLWLHDLASNRARALEGTAGAGQPFWSPDAAWVGFVAQGKLKRMRATGGPPETICDFPGTDGSAGLGYGLGATWSTNGTVVFAPFAAGPLYQVPAAGGVATPVTTVDETAGETGHRYPSFLPDGRRFVYLVRSNRPERQGIYAGALDAPMRVLLTHADSNAAYAHPGYLLFVREATLFAQSFDPRRLTLSGDAVPVVSAMIPGPTVRYAPFSAGGDVLAFRPGGVTETQLVRVNREGGRRGVIGPPGRYPANPSLAPDGSQIAMGRFDLQTGGADLWLFDLARGVSSRFTFERSLELAPLWDGDSRRILFASNRAGVWDIYARAVDRGTGSLDDSDHLLLQSGSNKYPQTWSADGRWLIFTSADPETGEDLWMAPADGSAAPRPFVVADFNQREAQLSPDGRWMAYASNESGRFEIYVRPYPTGPGHWKVSIDGGVEPRWRDDGRELFFVGPDRRLRAVSIARSDTFAPGAPALLFDARIADTWWWDYVVLPGGREFVLKQAADGDRSSPVTVVVNWRR
jgi:Tol biopolymer transport system component